MRNTDVYVVVVGKVLAKLILSWRWEGSVKMGLGL
jgi:hypothetical protein